MIIRMNAALLAWFLAHQPPAPLACLARWYDVYPQQRGAAWFATLRDGTALPYDDGRSKTFDEQFEHGEFEQLREWLTEHVYRWGRVFTPQELLKRAAGGAVDPEPYVRYLERKLNDLVVAGSAVG